MKRKLGIWNCIVELSSNVGAAIGCMFLMAMVVMVTVGTIARFFGMPFAFVDEYSAYFLLIMGFLGLAYGLKEGAHVYVEIIINRLPGRTRSALEVFAALVALFVSGICFWFGFKLCLESFRTHRKALTIMETPLWIPQFFVWVGLLILFLALLAYMINKLKDFQKKETKNFNS